MDSDEFFAVHRDDAGVLEIRMRDGRAGGDAPAVWSRELLHGWGRVLREAASDPGTEALVLTGTGDFWLAGVDPVSFAVPVRDWSPREVVAQWRAGVRLLEALVVEVEVPTIGVLNGPGFRQEIALLCDLTVCAESVVIGDGNFGAGSVPGDGMFLALAELIGAKRAAAAVYLGRTFGAAEALELGLVTEVCPDGTAVRRARELAAQIVAGPAHARRWRMRWCRGAGSGGWWRSCAVSTRCSCWRRGRTRRGCLTDVMGGG